VENLTKNHFYQENLTFLFQEVNRIRSILEQSLNQEEYNNTNLLDINNQDSRLNHLAQKFNLSNFERDILLLCVGYEIDPSFEELCTKINGNSNKNYPTLSLALSLFPNPSWQVISPSFPLQKWQLIEFSPHLTITQAPIKIDKRIFCYLLGEKSFDEELRARVYPIPDNFKTTFLPQSQLHLIEQMYKVWSNSNSTNYPILQLCGAEISSKYAIAYQTCEKLGIDLKILSANLLPTEPQELNHFKQRWEREAILSNTVLLLDCDEINLENRHQESAISQFIENLNTLLIISSYKRISTRLKPLISFDVPSLSHHEQKALWENHLGDFSLELNGHLSQVVSQFNLSPNAIESACLTIKSNIETKEDLPKQLWNYCRTQARPKLDDLAQYIDSHASWDDLILPDKQKQILRDMEAHLKYKAQIYEDWGFGGREKRGLGVTSLFSGQSGTGKTMAAGVLAKTLNLDLYRIDLSTVVSKYIGETEKNLRKIFDAAETGGCILLFDEADALFGKRTEVKDSHDRHANVEVSYLLQRMESYQGLAILTTNLKSSLDQAFLRRIRFVIPFPFPDEDSRSEIWKRAFPPQTPTEGLDFWRLGALNLAGGNIKNIAINAAVFAAQEDKPVMMKHILKATQAEYVKLERTLTDREIYGWV
jgi:AAA+ superfamily predicted ATPase